MNILCKVLCKKCGGKTAGRGNCGLSLSRLFAPLLLIWGLTRTLLVKIRRISPFVLNISSLRSLLSMYNPSRPINIHGHYEALTENVHRRFIRHGFLNTVSPRNPFEFQPSSCSVARSLDQRKCCDMINVCNSVIENDLLFCMCAN